MGRGSGRGPCVGRGHEDHRVCCERLPAYSPREKWRAGAAQEDPGLIVACSRPCGAFDWPPSGSLACIIAGCGPPAADPSTSGASTSGTPTMSGRVDRAAVARPPPRHRPPRHRRCERLGSGCRIALAHASSTCRPGRTRTTSRPPSTAASGTRASRRRPRSSRPDDRGDQRVRSRPRVRAAWRHHRAGRRGLDHRRRPQCDRPRRRRHGDVPRLPPPAGPPEREPEHGRLRSAWDPLVHRADRACTADSIRRPERCASSTPRRVVGRTASPRPPGRGLVRVARGQPHRADRRSDRRRDGRRTADSEPGRAPRLVGFDGPDLGQRVGCGPGRGPRPGRPSSWREWSPARREPDGICRLRR